MARRAHLQTLLVCLVSGIFGCNEPEPEPSRLAAALGLDSELWPENIEIPDDLALLEELAGAIEVRRGAELDQLVDANDPGEQREDVSLFQSAIDTGFFDNEALFLVGDDLFAYQFRPEDGLGNGIDALRPNLRRIHTGEFGGADSLACQSCHAKGGPDGAGTNTQNAFLGGDGIHTSSADERSPPHLLGLGPVEALAAEMSAELRAIRAQVIADSAGTTVVLPLVSKGVSFGELSATDGTPDTSGVAGVDEDLVVKPFGWKGHQTLRGMIEESFRIHLGLVSAHAQELVRDGMVDATIYGPGDWFDVDNDGVSLEIEDGMITTLFAYLSQLEIPVLVPPRDPGLASKFGRGQAVFDALGCDSCHRRELRLSNSVISTYAQEAANAASPPTVINVGEEGETPRIEPADVERLTYKVPLFSDLRRHDMGPELASPRVHAGVPAQVFLTRPLWGLADTAPYMHDGRAPTIRAAILMHGGEAAETSTAFESASTEDQEALLVFLVSLARTPKLFVP